MEVNTHTINRINGFIETVSQQDVVEGIIATGYQEGAWAWIQLVAIFNDSLEYQKLLGRKLLEGAKGEILSLIADYQDGRSYQEKPSVRYQGADSEFFTVDCPSLCEKNATKELISGNLVFDRFGSLSQKREAVLERGILPILPTSCPLSEIPMVKKLKFKPAKF